MAIVADKGTRVVVQGITGREGSLHTQAMQEYGTRILAGVTPGKGGLEVSGVPVFDTVSEAINRFPEINTSAIFVPSRFAADAVYEAVDAGIMTIVVITEHIPVHDAIKFIAYARERRVKLIGPNCPGIISPGMTKIGIMPGHIFATGPIGVVSRSGTLTYEIAGSLTRAGLGQSTAIGIGGDPVTGLDFAEVVDMFQNDEETKGIVVIGEIGGDAEERLAEHLGRQRRPKPVVVFVAGRTAPPGKRMGHAGAIISMGSGTAEAKRTAFIEAGIPIADLPSDVPRLMASAVGRVYSSERMS